MTLYALWCCWASEKKTRTSHLSKHRVLDVLVEKNNENREKLPVMFRFADMANGS